MLAGWWSCNSIQDVLHGVAGIHDILQHHHVATFDAFVQADQVA